MWRRSQGRHLGQWEFPGGKLQGQEVPNSALVRELQEELGLTVQVGELLGSHTQGQITLSLYVVTGSLSEISWSEHDAIYWMGLNEDICLPISAMDISLVAMVRAYLQNQGSK